MVRSMNKLLRSIPYPIGSESRRMAIARIMRRSHCRYLDAAALVNAANQPARATPIQVEKCKAMTRQRSPCRCKALANGRCKLHGGHSTGPKTREGKLASRANSPYQSLTKKYARTRRGVCFPPTHLKEITNEHDRITGNRKPQGYDKD